MHGMNLSPIRCCSDPGKTHITFIGTTKYLFNIIILFNVYNITSIIR